MQNHQILLDMYQTAGVGVLALILGMLLTRVIPFLKKMCVPAPVSGGIIVSLTTLLFYSLFGIEFSFDGTIKDICMMIFFTSVGFQSNLKVIKQGGKPLVVMIALVTVLIIMQNGIAVGIATAMGLDSIIGMTAGSIPMAGGHGTAGGFSSLLKQMGIQSASSVTMAAATFGLVAGSVLGGPLGELLIRKYKLADVSTAEEDVMVGIEASDASPASRVESQKSNEGEFRIFTKAVYQIVIAIALGTLLSKALALTGITFPTYFGALMVAAIIRNSSEMAPKTFGSLQVDKIVSIGNLCLSLFLGMAMVSLRLWELADLALPLLAMLLAQVLFLALYGYFAAFPLLGKNYDAAVLVSGLCGFGLGATPNAMANMSAVCFKYKYAVNPFVIVPIIGAMFVDIINTGVITIFLNLVR